MNAMSGIGGGDAERYKRLNEASKAVDRIRARVKRQRDRLAQSEQQLAAAEAEHATAVDALQMRIVGT